MSIPQQRLDRRAPGRARNAAKARAFEAGRGGAEAQRRSRIAPFGERERAILVDERNDVGDGGEGDEVQVSFEKGVVGAEERLGR